MTVALLADAGALDLNSFERIVIGASIRYGHHQPIVAEFIGRHQALLESRPSAFFSVNIVARKPNKNTPETNPYCRKFLKSISWQPRLTAVFAGKLDYPSYGFVDRQMIRLIMLITKGPTDPKAVVEFTDWAQVEAFGPRGLRAYCLIGFDLNHQAHVLRKAPVNAVIHAEQGAVDGGLEVATAHFALEHRAVIAVEVGGLERDRVRFAQQRQLACDVGQLVAAEVEFVRNKAHLGVLGGIEQVGT